MGWHLTSGPKVAEWVAVQISGSVQEHSTAIGFAKDDRLTAGVLYEQWNGKSIVAHCAFNGFVSAAFIAAIFDYPFRHCGAAKVICPIPSDNRKSISLAEHLGFTEEARIKNASPTGDILLYTLEKERCRFLGERFRGKISSLSPSGP